MSSIPAPYKPLLAARNVERLPIATPLDLAELPIVRSVQKLEAPIDGELPPEAYRSRVRLTGPSGTRIEFVLEGSTEAGLPYGYDGEVLQALFTLINERGAADGVIRNPSLRMIADILGVPMTGKQAARVRSALFRLGNVKIISRIARDAELARQIEAGEATPRVPSSRRSLDETTAVMHLLDVVYTKVPGGDDRLDYIAINPIFIEQGIAGWVAWIDMEAFTGLRRPIAQRLYGLAAAQCAHGRPTPWTYDLEHLKALCGMSSKTPLREVKRNVEANGQVLVEQGILSSLTVTKVRSGKYQVAMEPGRLLSVARLLRGAGLLDLQEIRMQLMLLSAIGISGELARTLVRDNAEATYWALAYLLYSQEGSTEEERIRSPSGFVLATVRNGSNLAADQRFARWHERKVREASTPAASAERPAEAPRRLVPLESAPFPADPGAVPIWEGVRRSVEAAHADRPITATMLASVYADRIEGNTLICQTRNAFTHDWVRGAAMAVELSRHLSETTEGQLKELRVRLRAPSEDALVEEAR